MLRTAPFFPEGSSPLSPWAAGRSGTRRSFSAGLHRALTDLCRYFLSSAKKRRKDLVGIVITQNTTYDQPYHVARRVAALDHHFVWAGALIGLAVFGMLSFILFRGSVMMYTSLQGSFMMVFGLLGLLTKYHEVAPRVSENMLGKPMLLTSLVLIPAMMTAVAVVKEKETGSIANFRSTPVTRL